DCGCSTTGSFSSYFSDWALPPEFNLYLVDGATIHDLRQESSFSFDASGTTGSRDFTVLVTSEPLSYVWLNPGWSLVSIPVQTSDMSLSGLFRGAADAAYSWDGSQYQPVAGDLAPGVGYWVHSTTWGAFPLVGTPVRSLDLDLHAGWNLVGAPKGGAGLWNAPSQVSRTAFLWSCCGYYDTSYVYEGYGAWVYVDGQPASLHLGDAAIRAPALPSSSGPSDAPTFVLPFTAKDESGARDNATLQAAQGASDGFDASDVMEPPTPAATAWTSASFQAQGRSLDRSVVAPAGKAAYSLVVSRDAPAGSETLTWDASALPQGYAFELVDGAPRVDLREASTYSWSAPSGLSAKTFEVVVRQQDAPVCVLALGEGCAAQLPFDPASLL